MATIRYTFADGHTEEVEVTEEFKREYEFLLVREQAPHWKEMKQKERAGLRCVKNLSLDKFSEDGYDLPVAARIRSKGLFKKRSAANIAEKFFPVFPKSNGKHISCFISKATKKCRLPLCYISMRGRFDGVWNGRKKEF